jgi:hypothetical protein
MVLNRAQYLVYLFVLQPGARKPNHGIQLVNFSISVDARARFAHARPAHNRRFSFVSGPRVNLGNAHLRPEA